MLTRLQVSGFKNLVDVDVRFGPFTCIIGLNGVGKSNLFDAIRFLSLLAERVFTDAAQSVRDESGATTDIRELFHGAPDPPTRPMRFTAEMVVPDSAVDDFGQNAVPLCRLLRYTVELGYKPNGMLSGGGLQLLTEELTAIQPSEVKTAVSFPHSPGWLESVYEAPSPPRKVPFVSTRTVRGQRVVQLHHDGKHHRNTKLPAAPFPRTAVSRANASETPTAVVAKREMMSWRQYQLEPASLRKPDPINRVPDRPSVELDGSRLAATLYRLAMSEEGDGGRPDPDRLYARVGNRLHQLLPDIRRLFVVRDDQNKVYTLNARDRHGLVLPARGLSDGTLRFLALATMEADPDCDGVICFEEPENGIHPDRIPAMLELLQSIAVDPRLPVAEDNPLRQVIVNTHSQKVVEQVKAADLLAAVPRELVLTGRRVRGVAFKPRRVGWRAVGLGDRDLVPDGTLLPYLRRDRAAPAEDLGLFARPPAAL